MSCKVKKLMLKELNYKQKDINIGVLFFVIKIKVERRISMSSIAVFWLVLVIILGIIEAATILSHIGKGKPRRKETGNEQ